MIARGRDGTSGVGSPGHPYRVTVVGTSCCGKSTLSRQLAERLGGPHVELDAIHWGPNWTPCPPEEFRRRVEEATRGSIWVVDGNYAPVQDIVWQRATTLIWLDYSFARIFARALQRTVRRIIHRERLFAGNRESFRGAFLSRDSILWWVITTYRRRRRVYRARLRSGAFPHLGVFVFSHPRQVEAFLRDFSTGGIRDTRPSTTL